jgi:hypothetical protein
MTFTKMAVGGALVAALAGVVTAPAASAETAESAGVVVQANGTAVFGADGVNIRRTPFLSGKINGKGYRGQGADLICVAVGDPDPVSGIASWYKLRNRVTGVTGFVNYAYLDQVFWTNPQSC